MFDGCFCAYTAAKHSQKDPYYLQKMTTFYNSWLKAMTLGPSPLEFEKELRISELNLTYI